MVDTYDLSIAYPSVTASQLGRQNLSVTGPDVAIVAGAWDQPFKILNDRVTGYRVPGLVPVSSWRSVGASGNGFLHDCFLDVLIHAAGADPLMERLRLCWHDPSRKVLEAVGEMSNWGSDLGKHRGRGVGFTLSFGVPTAEVVEVTNTARGIRIDASSAESVGELWLWQFAKLMIKHDFYGLGGSEAIGFPDAGFELVVKALDGAK
jgi:isoquinoline 1-oxidoreductase subunit beta